MDYNTVKEWVTELELLKNSTIVLKEEINFDKTKTIAIDIESDKDLGIIVIYQDGHLFFDFMSKEDPMMKSNNWSEKFTNISELMGKIEEALMSNWGAV